METIPGTDLPPAQVIDWLRSEEGDFWRKTRTGMIYRHGPYSGILGEVCLPPEGGNRWCRWPDPYPGDELYA
jgi:hypothetical protein